MTRTPLFIRHHYFSASTRVTGVTSLPNASLAMAGNSMPANAAPIGLFEDRPF
jgi:hypothetical protein